MSNSESDGGAGNEWNEHGELAWTEFDWERYLREQDEAILRYLLLYEACKDAPDRIDAVAGKMDWGQETWSEETEEAGAEAEDIEAGAFEPEDDVYTLHKNPIFIATKAIYLGLNRSWVPLASVPANVPQPLAMAVLSSLQRGEEQAVQAIHALDFGDYAMAVSLFKRALSGLNGTLALINDDGVARHQRVLIWREESLPLLFDLREIWLRVISECREELDRPVDDES
ncbi:MAG: hypothetical protein EXS38_06850 [Opitutus sp.]|nr:hypothetical protein [Opitutus sp.]